VLDLLLLLFGFQCPSRQLICRYNDVSYYIAVSPYKLLFYGCSFFAGAEMIVSSFFQRGMPPGANPVVGSSGFEPRSGVMRSYTLYKRFSLCVSELQSLLMLFECPLSGFRTGGLKWIRTTDLALIRRTL
jgi:hypothetical protein